MSLLLLGVGYCVLGLGFTACAVWYWPKLYDTDPGSLLVCGVVAWPVVLVLLPFGLFLQRIADRSPHGRE